MRSYDDWKQSEPEYGEPPHLHCWEDHRDEAGSSTCMLEAGHDGAHKWTSDTEIVVAFDESPWSPYPEPPAGNPMVES